MRIISAAFATSLLAAQAQAEAPNVVTDILPIQALVSKVMAGVAEPTQLMPANVSPHGYAMRPSEARALQNADVVFWVGPELTPQLEESIEALAANSTAISLLHLNGTRELEFRESETFLEMSLGGDTDHHDDHDDGHEGHGDHDDHDEHTHDEHGEEHHDDDEHHEEAHDAHDHDDHDDHAEAGHDDHDDHKDHDEAGHDDHDDHDDHAHESHHAHSHDGVDPHAWLDPENARFWASAIALKLSEVDPENAATYRSNAADLEAELAALSASIADQMAPLSGHGFVVFHDAYQYFETRYGLTAAGAILGGDAAAPSAARLDSVRDTLTANNITCVFTEPQFNDKVVKAISDGLDLHSEELDPLGAKLGEADYSALIQGLANQFEACLMH